MRRRWLWPLLVLALAVLVWWAERGSSSRATGSRIEPVRGLGGDHPPGEMRPAPAASPAPAPAPVPAPAPETSPPR